MSWTSRNESIPIQQATKEQDVDRVNEFFNTKVIKEELHRFTYRPTLARAFERDDRRLFYAESGGDLIGGLMVWCESRVLDPDEGQIRLVAVHPDHRSQGLARGLCIEAEKFAQERGKDRMTADVAQDSTAIGFWKSCGYEIINEWETDNGREMFRVEKPFLRP